MKRADKPTILNVCDHGANSDARTRILRQAGYDVTEARNGQETLSILEKTVPDLIVLDLNLPDMTGREICHSVKSNPATSSVMVMQVMPTYVDPRDRATGLENGADACMTEPLEASEFLAGVKVLLRLRQAEKALHMVSREWRTTFDAIEDGVCLVDNVGKIRRVNRALARIFGRSIDDLIGMSCHDLLGEACDAFDRMLSTASPQNADLHLGDQVFLVGFYPVTNEATDHLQGSVCTFRDVTELQHSLQERERLLILEQKARSEAEAASRIKDDFLATVSHDLRGPLQAILIWTRLLREGQLDEAARIRTYESLDRSALSQARMVDDLLDLSRIVTGRLRLDASPCDLRPILLVSLETVQPFADARQITLQTEIDSGGGAIVGDPDRIQQILWNLLSNAVKFTDKGGNVTVRLQRTADSVAVSVSDTGQGIAPELIPHVFDHFRQGKDSPRGRSGGLGLGLSIARHLVELHGGTIHAESDGIGKGATFTLTLPLHPGSPPSDPA